MSLDSPDENDYKTNLFLKCQEAARNLDEPFRTKILSDSSILRSLNICLTDEVIVSIIKELTSIQQLTERQLHQQRQIFISKSEENVNNLLVKHQLEQRQTLIEAGLNEGESIVGIQRVERTINAQKLRQRSELNVLKEELKEKLEAFDRKIIFEFDNKKQEQQETLEAVGIPTFRCTNNPEEIKLQMAILFIIGEILELNPKLNK